jgi:hypothetical protein
MPVTSAINSLRSWRERQQARQDHERIDTDEANRDAHPLQDDEEQAERLSQQSSSATSDTALADAVSEEEEGDIENQTTPLETSMDPSSARDRQSSSRRTVTLEDLEEERELARRRTSGCVLIAAFVLFRLWIQAVAEILDCCWCVWWERAGLLVSFVTIANARKN